MSQRNVDDDLDWDYARSKFQELGKVKAKLKRYERVIEAAKCIFGSSQYVRHSAAWERDHEDRLSRLAATLEALEAAEKEER